MGAHPNQHSKSNALARDEASLKAAIVELQERLREVKSRSKEREKLLGYCRHHDFTRADLAWVYGQLAPMRINAKMRKQRQVEANKMAQRRGANA